MFSAGSLSGIIGRGPVDTSNSQKLEKKTAPPKAILKAVVVGNWGAGKTSLASTLLKKGYKFTDTYTPTWGSDYVGMYVIDEKHKLMFYDTVIGRLAYCPMLEDLAAILGFDVFGECSAKTNTGITEIFQEVAEQIRRSLDTPAPAPPQTEYCCSIS